MARWAPHRRGCVVKAIVWRDITHSHSVASMGEGCDVEVRRFAARSDSPRAAGKFKTWGVIVFGNRSLVGETFTRKADAQARAEAEAIGRIARLAVAFGLADAEHVRLRQIEAVRQRIDAAIVAAPTKREVRS